MYQALYRKWRPQTFDDVIGQEHITETLRNQIISGRLSHAYIFIGTRGTGKTSCARILAKAINCDNPDNGNPCCKCQSCISITEGNAMDVVELDAASNSGVDNIRALRDEAVFSPASVRKRVYIIDEVHMLSMNAFNALLKILEEPPPHLMFILATTELQKVPATILSRCQRHSFRRIDTPLITKHIEAVAVKEGLSLSHDAAVLIAGLSEGGVRDALSLLDQCSSFDPIGADEVYAVTGLAGNKKIIGLFDSILKQDSYRAIESFSALWMDGKDPAILLRELCGLVRDVLIINSSGSAGELMIRGAYELSELKRFSDILSGEELIYMLDILQKALDSMRDKQSTRITAEMCIISLCNKRCGDSITALRSRVAALEKVLDGGIPAAQPNIVEYAAQATAVPKTGRTPAPPAPAQAGANDSEIIDDELPFDMDTDEPGPLPPDNDNTFLSDTLSDAEAQEESHISPDIPVLNGKQTEIPPPSPDVAEDDGSLWDMVCKAVSNDISPLLGRMVTHKSHIRGFLEDEEFVIAISDPLLCKRFEREDNMALFSNALQKLLDREVMLKVIEVGNTELATRDVKELLAFPEFKTIN